MFPLASFSNYPRPFGQLLPKLNDVVFIFLLMILCLIFPANAGILLEHAPACPEQYGVQVSYLLYKTKYR